MIRTYTSWDDTFFTTGKKSANHREKNGGQQQRKRGRRGGHLVKYHKKFSNTPLLTIILSNVQRLYNKADEFFFKGLQMTRTLHIVKFSVLLKHG